MKIALFDGPEELALAAAIHLVDQANRAFSSGSGSFSVALSGGSTPRLMYQALAASPAPTRDLLARVDYFFGDERSVPNDHKDSNIRLAREGFLAPLQIPGERIHPVDGGAADLAAEARRHAEELTRLVPIHNCAGVPILDLVFLGMGDDGHTASLFPGTAALAITDRLFVENDVPQLATRRLTLTYPTLNASRSRVILCAGKGKALVLRELLTRLHHGHDPVFPIERLNQEGLLWMLDREAASEIPLAVLQHYALPG